MAILKGNLAKARLRERDRVRGLLQVQGEASIGFGITSAVLHRPISRKSPNFLTGHIKRNLIWRIERWYELRGSLKIKRVLGKIVPGRADTDTTSSGAQFPVETAHAA
jgi:hypothetical protein